MAVSDVVSSEPDVFVCEEDPHRTLNVEAQCHLDVARGSPISSSTVLAVTRS